MCNNTHISAQAQLHTSPQTRLYSRLLYNYILQFDYTKLHITVHFTALHCTTLHYVTLQCTTSTPDHTTSTTVTTDATTNATTTIAIKCVLYTRNMLALKH